MCRPASSRREDPVDEMRLAVGADDERGLADELIDAPQTVRGRHEGIAGDARIAMR